MAYKKVTVSFKNIFQTYNSLDSIILPLMYMICYFIEEIIVFTLHNFIYMTTAATTETVIIMYVNNTNCIIITFCFSMFLNVRTINI